MAADATTAMTIDFLRARLLSERSVSRAAKERADQLAWRVTELEEQLRTVTTQRRKAERAAAEVLAILESQGFARLSDAPDSASSSDDDDTDGPEATASSGGGKEVEDALSGSTPGGTAAAAAADGALSWKGRAAGHDSERRQQHKGRQPRPRHSHSHSHSHSHRRGYFYLLTADSSPKYQPGQSCRKIKRKELRFHTEGEEAKDNNVVESPEEVQERTDCTVCTDEQPDLDGEVSQDGRGSCGGGMVEEDSIASDQYAIEYGKDGEMERVLEQQAELIGQYEAEENAQREWEKKFSTSRDSAVGDVELGDKVNQIEKACEQRDKAAQIVGKEVVCQEERSSDEHLPGINSPSECLSKDSASELPPNEPKESAIEQHKVVESDNDFGQATATVSSVDSETRVSKDELVNRSCNDIIEGIRNNLGRSEPSLQGSYDSNPNARHDEGQGNESSDSGSNYHVNARSYEHYINTPSDTSPLSEWSSSCFHNHTDNQIETQLYQPTSDDVGGVLEALQRAKMSLREKLQRPIPPSLTMLALPAPEDPYTKDDLPVRDTQLSLSRSRPPSQEILALPEPADYLSRILPQDDVKVPVGLAGLFRLPTDPFPQNVVCSPDGYGLRLSLTATSRHTIFSSNRANHAMSTPSLSQYDTGFSSDSYRSRRSSMLLPNFTADDTSFLPEVPRSKENLRRGVHSGDAGMLFHYSGDYSF